MTETAVSSAGYLHARYAESLAEFARPRRLTASGGWILERAIPGQQARDAMGCYPLFTCHDWTALASDLDHLDQNLVSLVVVTDPFGKYTEQLLTQAFPDVLLPFKQHLVSDLEQERESFVTNHHRYYARKALEKITVEHCPDPTESVEEWCTLYSALVERHHLKGIKAFSRAAFAEQLRVPGLVMLRATHEGKTVGAHLWYRQGQVAYSHLTASNETGYKLMAAYALSWKALECFAGQVRWLDWGAGAGLDEKGTDGLTRFKRGWASDTRLAYLGGRICNQARYQELTAARGTAGASYFPAYRADEFR